jgi:WD40 repeat protein
VYAVAVSPDGERLFAGSWHDDVRVSDARTGEALAVLPSNAAHVFALDVSPDGGRLVVYGFPNIVEVWSVHTRRRLAERNLGGRVWCRSAVCSSDGEHVLVTTAGVVYVLDARTLETVHATLSADADVRCRTISAAAWSRGSGRRCGSLGSRTPARSPASRWSIRSGPSPSIRRSAGRFLVDRDHEVHVWNLESGKLERSFPGPPGAIHDLVFSPDGQRLFFAGTEGVVHVWDPEIGVKVAELAGHTSYVMQLAFSPDGTRLFSGSGDGTVRVWSTKPKHVIGRVRSGFPSNPRAPLGRGPRAPLRAWREYLPRGLAGASGWPRRRARLFAASPRASRPARRPGASRAAGSAGVRRSRRSRTR